MKDDILFVSFEPQEPENERLSAFLDTVFEATAVDYTSEGKLRYSVYAPSTFDIKTLEDEAKKQNITLPPYQVQTIKNKNWLAETAVRFAPIETGDFIIYDITDTPIKNSKKIALQIDGSVAFGSTHETTHLCLEALSDLVASGLTPRSILDIGTGSGILAIAGAKIWAKSLQSALGVDIDAASVCLAKQNAKLNGVNQTINLFKGNGYRPKIIARHTPFDVIFANILARPLMSMAQQSAQHIAPNGLMILSGFTYDQTDWVLSAYQKAGFKLIKTYQKRKWCAALIQKTQTLNDLQTNLKETEACFMTRDNMFLGEDVLDTENKILEISGFTGSNGSMLIGRHRAWLFVDGRYSLQARMEVKKGIEVVDSANFIKDAAQIFKSAGFETLIVNPWSLSVQDAQYFIGQDICLVSQPSAPRSSFFAQPNVFTHDLRFAGLSSKQKCQMAAQNFALGADALLLTSPEDISWLANLRASDLPYTPVVRRFGLLKSDATLKIYPFSQIEKLKKDMAKCTHVMADFSKTPLALAVECQNLRDVRPNIVSLFKLQKNDVELKGFVNAHIRDGAALVKFLCWLETHYHNLSELEVVKALHDFRIREKHYVSESFATIAAVKQNAAIVHYEPTPKTNKKMAQNTLLLLDSGAQYFDGTTDVTRTVAFGHITDDVKTSFTQVLKAHIALANHIFDIKTPAYELDKICRDTLLKYGKDYAHGTGHSVGHFSNVHESPFAINAHNTTPVLPHYITSIEPGYYVKGAYGIRIENLVYTEYTPDGKHLCFKPLTLCPIDRNLIKQDMLTEAEKMWLNTYHREVFEALAPRLNKVQKAWLAFKCQKI